MKDFSRTTKEQWALDFGCDISEVVNIEVDDSLCFHIKIWRTLHFIFSMNRNVIDEFKNSIHSDEYKEYKDGICNHLKKMDDARREMNIFSQALFFILMFPICFFCLCFLLLFFAFNYFKVLNAVFKNAIKTRKEFNDGKTCGLMYMHEHENSMYLPKKYPGYDVECTISHEHIHIKQKKYYLESIALQCHTPNYYLFNSNRNNDKLFFYLFSPVELEARLHEVVKAIYKKNSKLPRSKLEFLSDFESYKYYALSLDSKRRKESFELGYDNSVNKTFHYKTLSKNTDSQLFLIFHAIDSSKLMYAFLEEILFPCYCNLVRYYGDEKLYQKLISEHVGPSRFDQFIASPNSN